MSKNSHKKLILTKSKNIFLFGIINSFVVTIGYNIDKIRDLVEFGNPSFIAEALNFKKLENAFNEEEVDTTGVEVLSNDKD